VQANQPRFTQVRAAAAAAAAVVSTPSLPSTSSDLTTESASGNGLNPVEDSSDSVLSPSQDGSPWLDDAYWGDGDVELRHILAQSAVLLNNSDREASEQYAIASAPQRRPSPGGESLTMSDTRIRLARQTVGFGESDGGISNDERTGSSHLGRERRLMKRATTRSNGMNAAAAAATTVADGGDLSLNGLGCTTGDLLK
jgi:hypothetical protein